MKISVLLELLTTFRLEEAIERFLFQKRIMTRGGVEKFGNWGFVLHEIHY
jgi:hypothetical protein